MINFAYPVRGDYFQDSKEDQETLDRIQVELFPLLGWMKYLKSLVILRNADSLVNKEFIFMEKLIGLLLPQLQSLERLWVPEDYALHDSMNLLLKSINVHDVPNLDGNLLKGEQFANLEHISGDLNFNQFGLHPDLKYAVGHCKRDKKVYSRRFESI